VVGHDWGAGAAYTIAAVAPERIDAIVALALPYQPRGAFTIPPFEQARAFWYQWLMYLDAGARAVANEPRDPRYEPLAQRLAQVEYIQIPTLMIQGAEDRGDEPAGSADLQRYFASYRRVLLDGVGHFPHREAPDAVAEAIHRHLSVTPD